MAASANVHASDPSRVAMFEPVHGSAPPLAGKDVANPFAALLTAGMMLTHLGWPEEERRIERCVTRAIDEGACTVDVGGKLGTRAAGAWVREQVAREL
jgi:3-isopropylmalate dehydrogenase